jgi:hypothetical protein
MVTADARKLDIGADQGGSSIDTGVSAATGKGEACVTCVTWVLSLLASSSLLLEFVRLRDFGRWSKDPISCSFRRVSKATIRCEVIIGQNRDNAITQYLEACDTYIVDFSVL